MSPENEFKFIEQDFITQQLGISLKRPVLVLGWILRIIVPVARSLDKHGIPVDVADFAVGPQPVSRSIRDFKRVPHPDLDPAGFLHGLIDFIRRGGHDMIIPTDDQALTAITNHYDDFKKVIYVACPPPRTTILILDKSRALEIARKCGIQTPRTKLISHSSQLLECFEDFSFPWIVKPAQKQSSVEDVKSLKLKSPDEVRAKFCRNQTFAPPMLLQEYCPGAGVGVELLMHKGDCLAAFQHRRLKELPYSGGVSVTAVAESPNSELLEKCIALLRALDWEGPAMVEFKMNAEDRSAVFLEVNGRYWGTIALPIFLGINFPLYHWQILHGEAIAVPSSYAAGTRWRWMAGHVWRLHELVLGARSSKSARLELRRSFSEWASLLESSIQDSLFFPSDPMPAVFDFAGVVKHLSVCDAKAVFRRLSRIWTRKNN